MRLLVCGSRTFVSTAPIHAAVAWCNSGSQPLVVIHGAARGADSIADHAAASIGVEVWAYPADWGNDGRAAGPIRNQRMLDLGRPDLVWAFVDKPLAESKGTADMVRRARKANITVYVTEVLS